MNIPIRDLEGRPHYVVPAVMIVEGVLNGSHGPIFYPADELRKSARAWNGKPVVVYHPDMYSDGLAGNPQVFNRQKVGTIFNVRYDNRRLRAEAWIDVERVASVDGRIRQAILSRRTMEVSTGLMLEAVSNSGSYGGRSYELVAQNLQPDHLAILPDQIGACSIADGAGLVRNEHAFEPLLAPAMHFCGT